jgi:hypothetical protein
MSDEVIAPEGAEGGSAGSPEGQQAEPQTEQQVAETPAAAPDYLTRAAFEEAMGGFSSSQQQRIDELNQQLRAMAAHQKRMAQPAPQPTKSEPLVPPLPDFANMDQYKFHELMGKLANGPMEQIQKLQQRLESFEQSQRQQTEADRTYQLFNTQTEEAKRLFPIFQDKDNFELLTNQVVAAVYQSNGNPRSVNVPAIAKRLQDRIYAIADAKYKAKLGGVPAAVPGAPAAPGKTPPIKGSASSPASKQEFKEIKSVRDYEDNLDKFFHQLGSQIAADRTGGD